MSYINIYSIYSFLEDPRGCLANHNKQTKNEISKILYSPKCRGLTFEIQKTNTDLQADKNKYRIFLIVADNNVIIYNFCPFNGLLSGTCQAKAYVFL
jgi:hypothetical protein